jgi:hypothetical protein
MHPASSKRNSKGFPILGLCGVLLLACGALAIASDAFACPNCNCYWSTDCASGLTCNWSSGCRVWSANGKTIDGTCTGAGGANAIGADQTLIAAQALDLWLRAYENAAHHGGAPNAKLVAEARALPLSPEQHAAIRQAAINTMIELFGETRDADDSQGAVTLPPDLVICIVDGSAGANAGGNGTLKRLAPDDIAVANIVREAMVAELMNPFRSDYERIMERLEQEAPNYVGYGTCQYPTPSTDRFPFKNGYDCMKKESLRLVRSLLAPSVS